LEGLVERAVVVRDERHHELGTMAQPVGFEHLDLRVVSRANEAVHEGDELSRTRGPAVAEHDVVNILEVDAGEFVDEIDGVEEVLDGDQLEVPGALLAAHYFGQGGRGSAMATAGIDVD